MRKRGCLNRSAWRFVRVFGIACGIAASLIFVQGDMPADAQTRQTSASRLAQLVEANVIAVHAYQVLLAQKSGKGDAGCYNPEKISAGELESLAEHQGKLLKSELSAVRAWVNGRPSNFDPTQDLEPILASGLTVPSTAPVNVFTDYLHARTRADTVQIRAIASLYQTVLEVERDGDRLQE